MTSTHASVRCSILVFTDIRRCTPRVHKNKSMQHHTLGSGTAEFQVTWPPKLREGTYLVKNVRARFEYRKTIAAHEKQVIMQEKALACDVRLYAPSESVSCNRRSNRWLCVSAFISPNFLRLLSTSLRIFVKKKERKSAIKGFRFHR